MKTQLTTALITVGTLLFILSCKHESIIDTTTATTGGNTGGNNTGSGNGNNGSSGNTCDPNKVYFQQQVLPILISNCTMSGCHDATSRQDGVILTSYENVMRTADVRPGNPAGSKLYKMITETDPKKRMPQGKPALSQDNINLIYKWIQLGATNETCTNNTCDVSNVTYSTTIKTIVSNKCVGCHSGSAPANGTDFTNYTVLKAKATEMRNGTSVLYGAISQQAGFSAMPKNGNKLSDCEIAQFKKWIDAGAPNN